MIISDLLKFFAKKVAMVYTLLVLICLLNNSQSIQAIIALTIGTVFSLVRFGFMEYILRTLSTNSNKTLVIVINILWYMFGLAIIGILIIRSLQIGVWTFLAALIGSLAVLIIVIVNSVTEALGITNNHFGQKVK